MRIPFSLVLIATSARIAGAAFVDSPVGPSVTNSASSIPFLTVTDQASSVRYQQVYRGSDFAGHGSLEYFITEIRFEMGAGSGPIDVVLPNVQVNLSTTLRAVDSLSPVFGNNIGPDNRLVYSGQLHLFPIGGGGDFGFRIPLQQPFRFD